MRFSRNGYNSDDIAQSEYSQVPEITSIQMETLTVKLSVSFVFLVSTQHSSISCVLWVCRIRVAYGKYKNNVQHAKYNLQMKYALWLYLTEKWAEIRATVTPIIKSCKGMYSSVRVFKYAHCLVQIVIKFLFIGVAHVQMLWTYKNLQKLSKFCSERKQVASYLSSTDCMTDVFAANKQKCKEKWHIITIVYVCNARACKHLSVFHYIDDPQSFETNF